MANQEHLKVLKKGSEIWNQWRKEHPDVQPDLSKANLMRLSLSNANFSETFLQWVNLSEANLSYVDLSKAYLSRASLGGANLSGADLSYARVGWTIFGDVDLSTVKGLDKVKHLGPSTIGIDTIYRSKGDIPEVFLRRSGVPNILITYTHSLIGTPIEYYTCFISYSSRDQTFAERLYNDLQSKGVLCWFAPEDLKIGDKIRPRIDESIRKYDKLLLVLSENSVSSKWVEYEVEAALDKEQEGKPSVLFPVRLDKTVMDSTMAWAAHIKRTRHIGDFTRWKNHDAYQIALNRLLRDLKV